MLLCFTFVFDNINILYFCKEIYVILTLLVFNEKVQLVMFLGTFPEVLVTMIHEHGHTSWQT